MLYRLGVCAGVACKAYKWCRAGDWAKPLAAWMLVMLAVCGQALAAPELFFYPPPLRLTPQVVASGLVTVSAEQITVHFPVVPEMSGVAMVVYWSQLCPEENHCDFSIIDQVISYWQQRGKKVVLGVATVGYPAAFKHGDSVVFQTATPDWVLRKVRTQSEPSRILGIAPGHKPGQIDSSAVYPAFTDPAFLHEVDGLVAALARRYDGNPGIAYLRMSLGFLTEDHPNDGLRYLVEDLTDRGWIAYCESVRAIFSRSFKRTQLEFDAGRLYWIMGQGSAPDRSQVQHLLDGMSASGVFIAYNGLNSTSIDLLNKPAGSSGPSQAMHFLQHLRAIGRPIGLEAEGPARVTMPDMPAVLAAVASLRPSRVILFSSEAALVRYSRDEAGNQALVDLSLMSRNRLPEFETQAVSLVQGVMAH
jgi:hypothetical protein